MNKWIDFVKNYMNEHKISWACALTEIKQKQLYKKHPIIGGGDYQDMVRHVMSKHNMDWYDAICHIQRENYINRDVPLNVWVVTKPLKSELHNPPP